MSLDVSKLENVKRAGVNISARCPMCASFGRDRAGIHLSILPDGKYNCIAYSNDSEHNKGIYRLVGNGEISNNVDTIPEEKIEIERIYDIKFLDKLVKDYTYWNGRGISSEVVEKFKGGIATEGQMKNRWVFPIFNENDEIIGFTGRSLDPDTKLRWKHIGKVSTWVWGGLDEIRHSREVTLVEGVGCCLALDENGIKNSLVLWGTNMSQHILGFLISVNPKKIIISTNNDVVHTVGQNGAYKINNILNKFFDKNVTKIIFPNKKDFLDCMTTKDWAEWKDKYEKS